MTKGYSWALTDAEVEEAISATVTIDGGDLNGVSPAMDYLDLQLLDGGAI